MYKAGEDALEWELADAALVEAKRQEQLAAVQTDAAENAEQLQIDVDAIAAYGDIGSDRQVVAEMLNLDLDSCRNMPLRRSAIVSTKCWMSLASQLMATPTQP